MSDPRTSRGAGLERFRRALRAVRAVSGFLVLLTECLVTRQLRILGWLRREERPHRSPREPR